MTIEEIQARKECQTFDCKSIQIDPKALAIPIVAMANADGGVLAIGVSDKTRRIEGVDDKSKKLNFDERMQLLYDKGERYYEDKDVYGATINDVDMNLVGDYVNVIGYGKSAMEYLSENNDFVTEVDGQQKASTACILLFGKNPQRFFPRARTRFIRYEGREEKVGREMNVIKDVTFEDG